MIRPPARGQGIVRILVGDWVEQMRTLPDACVQMVGPTSPPYLGLRSYLPAGHPDKAKEVGSESSPDEFVRAMVEGFREARRVLRDDGIFVLNLGDSYAGSGKGPTGQNGIGDQGKRQGFTGKNAGFNARWGQGGGQLKQESAGMQRQMGAVPGCKPKDLMMIPFRVAIALQQDGWYLRSVMPWVKRNCLSGGAWVYVRSQKGDMPMTVKELARLDPSTVQLWNGARWTRLVKVWRVQPEGDPLEIRLRSGETIGCTPDHRWPTQRGLLHARDLTVGDVIQTTRLPEREDARQPAGLANDDIGWFVGLYIAEGFRDHHVIHISSHTKEAERQARLERIAAAYDGTCWTRHNGGRSMTINLSGAVLHGILDAYVEGHGAANKHLRMKAWQRSDGFLRAVLDGYLHGDGHYDEQNRRWRLGFCKNDRWANDLRTLCARLGVGLRLYRTQHQLGNRRLPGWRGQIRFDLSERRPGWSGFKLAEDGEIVGIGKSRGRSFWDLEVADDPHLFALASGVLTHNSMPESVKDRPSMSVEYLFLLSKNSRYYWDGEAIRQPNSPSRPDRIGLVKRSSEKQLRSREQGGNGFNPASESPYGIGGRAFRNSDPFFNTWQGLWCDEDGDPLALIVNPQPLSLAHFATFPPRLVEPFVRAGTRKGDLILDPFGGAGTVGLVASRLGRDAVLCELNPEYAEMARRRIEADAGPLLGETVSVETPEQTSLFAAEVAG